MDTTIHGMQQHFATMYEGRNYFVNGSFHQRACHFTRRVGRIVDAKRKNERMAGRLARAVSYFMSVVNYFGGRVDLERGLMEKFPPFGCLYCGYKPCGCGDAKRPDPTEYRHYEEQKNWTLRRWQQHFFEVYGHRHMGNFWKAHGRLDSEWGELCILNVDGPKTPLHPIAALKECEQEAADVFNWIVTLAYVENVDLEQAVVERYETCPGCTFSQCDCPLVFISPDGKYLSRVTVPGMFEQKKPS